MQSSKDVDARTDIWSLGAILHELLAGSPPFQGETITALCAHVMTDPAPPLALLRPDVHLGLEGVVLRCLEKDRAKRYATVAEFARALAGFGSEAAHASAARIERTVEGGIDRHPTSANMTTPVAARSAVSSRSYPSAIKRPIAGYALAAAAVLLFVGGVGWKLETQASAIRAAEHEVPLAVLAPRAGLPIPPIPSALAPPGATTASATPPTSPIVTTTGAQVAAPVATAAPIATAAAPVAMASATSSSSPAPAATPPVAVAATIPPPAVHRHHVRHPAVSRTEPSGTSTDENPYAAEAIAVPARMPVAAPSPVPVPSASAPATDPNELFDQRK
jgi:serine/threonine-protein kinase